MSRVTKVMSHIIGVRKKADSQKGVRKAADSQKKGSSKQKFWEPLLYTMPVVSEKTLKMMILKKKVVTLYLDRKCVNSN